MRAFFAVGSASAAIRHLGGSSALCSFAYLDVFWKVSDAAKLRAQCDRMFLDSGAYTAWKQGTPIDLGRYIEFIRTHVGAWDHFAALDDILDPFTSIGNWIRMRRELPEVADRIVPVWHEGEPFEVLGAYLDWAPYVGIGRTDARRSAPRTRALYDSVFSRYPNAKLHAFGCGHPEMLEPFPFQSFDSSTWERDSTYSEKHGYPWGWADRDTRMRAYVQAQNKIRHRPKLTPAA